MRPFGNNVFCYVFKMSSWVARILAISLGLYNYKLHGFHIKIEIKVKTGSVSYSPIPSLRRRQWHPTPVLLPGESLGQRSQVGCSPWGREESDTTEQLHFHFSLSCIGEGNGNPLQCSCLENPRDGGAWWAAVYGVAQSWTRLKRLSSSSSSTPSLFPSHSQSLVLLKSSRPMRFEGQ